jgi:hypothetical protein
LPTGSHSPIRVAIARIAGAGTSKTIEGCPLRSEALIESTSAAPNMRPRSDGLTGDASIFTITSLSLGDAMSTSNKAHSMVPSSWTQDCIWRLFILISYRFILAQVVFTAPSRANIIFESNAYKGK